jgi:predicted ATPase/transcriptional regulator with XRE-family HTH domain
MEEAARPIFFGEWLKFRRKELDLTQAELAHRAGCSLPALRKIEAGERRPSKQLAELLGRSLEIPSENLQNFIRVARGELNIERLSSLNHAPSDINLQDHRTGSLPGHLPGNLTPFIGRERELAALEQLLRDPKCKLITLVGSGGIGKTRLAIEVASQHKDQFPDGIWFISLTSLNSSEYLVPAIADALDFQFQDPAKPLEQLLNFLQDKRALLVLDNLEHLLDGVGLFNDILACSPQIKMLGTSRERLNLLSEWLFDIQGLPVPPYNQVEQFDEYSSIALFLQCARRIQTDFTMQDNDRKWVLRICQLLEGMPLGIELAAAWVGLLSCEEIAKEIERNFDFLTISMRDLPDRHRSMKATLDHSWNLLTPEEKATLSRLSVFRGSFERIAAEEICGATLSVLSSLKDKSLLRRVDKGRYNLHEMIHQYASLRLSEDAREEELTKDQHALYFAQRLSNWEKTLQSSRQVETLIEMAQDIDNLRLAWQRMITCCDFNIRKITLFDPNIFHSSLFSLSLFYEMRCRNMEAVSIFGQSIECLKASRDIYENPEDKPYYEIVLGHITAYLGLHHTYILKYQQAIVLLEEAVRLLEHDQTHVIKAQAQVMLGWAYQYLFKLPKAIDLYTDSLMIFQSENVVWWKTLTLELLAGAYITVGKNEESVPLYEEALKLAEPGDLRLRTPLLTGLGRVYYLRGDYHEAEKVMKECLDLCLLLGNSRQTALCLLCVGQIAMALGQIQKAEKNFRESAEMLDDFGESSDLGVVLLYLGKSLATLQRNDEARKTFQKLCQIGQVINLPSMVCIGLINIAQLLLDEGHTQKAVEMILVLRRFPLVVKTWQNESDQLWNEIRLRFSEQEINAALSRINSWTLESLLDLS